jgi:hypothetical protein
MVSHESKQKASSATAIHCHLTIAVVFDKSDNAVHHILLLNTPYKKGHKCMVCANKELCPHTLEDNNYTDEQINQQAQVSHLNLSQAPLVFQDGAIDIYTLSTRYLHDVYTISTRCLHDI